MDFITTVLISLTSWKGRKKRLNICKFHNKNSPEVKYKMEGESDALKSK